MKWLVDDWRDAWRWLSMRCMLLAASILGAWLCIPDELRASVPRWMEQKITLAVLTLGIIGRVVRQKGKPRVPD